MVEARRSYPLPKKVRETILAATRADTQYHKEREQGEKARWDFYDSYLDEPNDGYDSSFQITFACLLPEGEFSLRSYIEHLLRRKRGAAIGIEFGGPGSNLFGDFSQGFFRQTAGVTLADIRTDSTKKKGQRASSYGYCREYVFQPNTTGSSKLAFGKKS